MSSFLQRFVVDDGGATAIEYGLIAALIAVALIAAISTLGNKISSTFATVGNAMP